MLNRRRSRNVLADELTVPVRAETAVSLSEHHAPQRAPEREHSPSIIMTIIIIMNGTKGKRVVLGQRQLNIMPYYWGAPP